MAKKTYKFWANNPSDPTDQKLMASFELGTDGKAKANVHSKEIEDRVKNGFHTDDGKLTLEDNAEEFLKLLAANYAMSTFVSVEVL